MRPLLLATLVIVAFAQSPQTYSAKDPGVTAPKNIHRLEPTYSDDARQERISGKVVLEVVIDTDGKPRDITVKSALYPSLDANAIKALSQWRFEPGKKDNQPVRVKATVEFNFAI